MAMHLVNARVLAGDDFVDGLTVRVEGDQIAAVAPSVRLRDPEAVEHDLGGAWLVPGFIDCQVNGGGGVLFNNTPDVATLQRIGAAHRRFGTTTLLPICAQSMVQLLAMMQLRPMVTPEPITVLAPMTVFRPISTLAPSTTFGPSTTPSSSS